MFRFCRRAFPASSLLFFISVSNTFSQIEITALEKNFNAFTATNEIKCIRFADFSEQPEVQVGMVLEVGDLLISEVDDVVMTINYKPDDPGMIFSGRFRVVIAPASEQEVALNLLSGNVDVQTDTATSISAGETLLVSKRAQYAIRTYRLNNVPVQDVTVYEGEVSFKSLDLTQNLAAGKKVRTANSGTTRLLPIENDDLRATADLYSRASLGKALLAGEPLSELRIVYSNLTQHYYEVLRNPNDANARQELARQLLTIQVSDYALYQLTRAEKYSPSTDNEFKAQVLMAKGAAYSQLQMESKSKELYQKARSYDAQIIEKTDLAGYDVRYDPQREIVAQRDGVVQKEAEKATPSRQKYLLSLLESRDFKTAIAGFEERVNGKQENSLDYYGLAFAYHNLQDRGQALQHAATALKHNETDRLLSNDQIQFCKEVAAGARNKNRN
jgi:hypothetical protein